MQMYPEQIAKALVNETFHSRRLVVGLFVVVNAAMLTAGWFWPKGYTASTSILVEEKNIIMPLMQGAAVATEVTDRSKNAREVIFGRKIMDPVLEYGGWLSTQPSAEERELIIEGIKKRMVISTVGKNILRIEYRDIDPRSSNLEARGGSDSEMSTRMNELHTRIERTTQELREAEIKGSSLERQVFGEAEVTAAVTREGQYRARIGELQSKLDTLRLSYHDTHPDIIQVKQQIQDLTDGINVQRERREQTKRSGRIEPDETVLNNPVYQQLRRELSQNQVTVDALKARIVEAQRQLQEEISRGKRLHSGDAHLAELTRDYQVNRDLYQDLLRRRENARVSMNLDRDRQGLTLKIQEPATLPLHASGLWFAHFVAGGLVLGIMLPLFLLFARLHVDPRIRVGNAILRAHKIPVAAVVPHLWSPGELKALRLELVLLMLAVGATLAVSATLSMYRLIPAA